MSNRINKIIILVLISCMIIFVFLSFSSCLFPFRSIAGSGKVITEQREISGINEVNFDGFGNLFIKQSETESLTIEAEDNIVKNIKTEVSGNKLTIRFNKGLIPVPTRQVYITLNLKNLSQINFAGAGSIECDNFKTENFEINSSGAGDIKLNIEAKTLVSKITGAGEIQISGAAESQEIKITGAGSYNGKDLISNKCKITISGAGSATVNVKDLLDVKISGVGSINYIGDPEVSKDISGAGSVKKLGE